MGFRARKRFGQHFLCSEPHIRGILQAINARSIDHLVEIGPGLGVLTRELIPACNRLDAIELDRDLGERLASLSHQYPHFHLHMGDVLDFHLNSLSEQPTLRVVGNLPYNITTPLLFHLFKQHASIRDMHFLVQKEVANRLSAPVNSPNYSRLSVIVQYYCHVTSLLDVPPSAFNPPPKVQSAFIRLQWAPPQKERPHCLSTFEKVVAMAFNQRRKTLQNSLKSVVGIEKIKACGIDPTTRAQNVSVAQFVQLSNVTKL